MQPFVLIVEDDAELAYMLCEGLRNNGYRATHCQDAVQALIMAESLRLGAILLDIHLPHFGSGIDVYQKLRQNPRMQRDLPILFITGLPPDQALAMIPREDPRVRLLLKPVSVDHLAQHLQELDPAAALRRSPATLA